MKEKALEVLLVEDNAGDVRLLREMFSKELPDSFKLTHLVRMREAELHLAKGGVDIVLLDMGLPDEHGLDTVRRSLAAAPDVPVIVLTGLEDETLATEAMKEGAQDYLIKGQIENRALPRALRHAIERHRLDQLLRDQQFYTRSLIESNIDSLMTTDPAGIITDVNQQTEALTGCTRDQLIGTAFKHYFTDSERAAAGIERVLSESKVTDYELTALARDGKETVVSYSAATLYDRDGKLQGVFAAARDVTERKRFEHALEKNNGELVRAKAAADQANRAKSDFLSGMSHEIRTPMNAILGMADMLWESDLDADQMHYVEVFRRAGSSLLALINNILDFSKIEAGHLELESVEFDLEEVVNQTLELIAAKAREKGILLESHLAPGLASSLIGDPTRLRQILINLLGNAVKFTESGKVVLAVQPDESGQPGEINFAVSDTGVGITPENLKTIFDDFTQADASTTRKYGGTGLGLGISRRLVESMHGHLTASSSAGEGSTFRFTVRFNPAPPGSFKVPLGLQDLHGQRVLVIDSDKTNCLILRETLQGWGLESDVFGLPEKALADLSVVMSGAQPYSLVILDSSLPGMDGFETCAAIRQIAPGLPVVMLTSDVRPEDPLRRRIAGLSGYAVKPLKRGDLLRLVCVAMNSREGENDQQNGSAEHKNRKPARPMRVLVAEDSLDNRLLVKAYMKGSPHVLTFAEDGKAAVDWFAASDFDLILMDKQMPIMNGLAATVAIRTIERERGDASPIPIIALTANARLEDVEMSRNAGCTAHLSKPISKYELLNVIAEYGERMKAPELLSTGLLQPIMIEMPPALAEIVPSYLAARREELPRIIELVAASDFKSIAMLGHNLKGTGAFYGFSELTRIGTALEVSAKQADAEALSVQFIELKDYLDRVELFSTV